MHLLYNYSVANFMLYLYNAAHNPNYMWDVASEEKDLDILTVYASNKQIAMRAKKYFNLKIEIPSNLLVELIVFHP